MNNQKLEYKYHLDKSRGTQPNKYPFEEIFKNDQSNSPRKRKKTANARGKYNQDLLVVKSFTRSDFGNTIRRSQTKRMIKLESNKLKKEMAANMKAIELQNNQV